MKWCEGPSKTHLVESDPLPLEESYGVKYVHGTEPLEGQRLNPRLEGGGTRKVGRVNGEQRPSTRGDP